MRTACSATCSPPSTTYMESGRRERSTPSSSCWRTTAGMPAPPASRSATPTRATGVDGSRRKDKNPRPRSAGGSRCRVLVGGLFRRQDLEHPRTADRAHALQRGTAIGHLHLLGIRNLALRLALHAVALIGCHRGFSTLRHCAFLRSGAWAGGCASLAGRGGSPGSPPPRTVTT